MNRMFELAGGEVDVHLEHDAIDEVSKLRLSKAVVFAEGDTSKLAHWYTVLTDKVLEIEAFIRAYKLADIDDDDWFRRTAGKVAYFEIASRWCEARLIQLGATPPYFPADPRTRQIASLNEKLNKLRTRIGILEGRQ